MWKQKPTRLDDKAILYRWEPMKLNNRRGHSQSFFKAWTSISTFNRRFNVKNCRMTLYIVKCISTKSMYNQPIWNILFARGCFEYQSFKILANDMQICNTGEVKTRSLTIISHFFCWGLTVKYIHTDNMPLP